MRRRLYNCGDGEVDEVDAHYDFEDGAAEETDE